MDRHDNTATTPGRRRFGSGHGWFLASVATAAYLFVYSGIAVHGQLPAAYPLLRQIGWVLGGISPLCAYMTFAWLGGRSRSAGRMGGGIILAAIVFFALQFVGVTMILFGVRGDSP